MPVDSAQNGQDSWRTAEDAENTEKDPEFRGAPLFGNEEMSQQPKDANSTFFSRLRGFA